MTIQRIRQYVLFLFAVVAAHCSTRKYDEPISRATEYFNKRGDKMLPVAVPILHNLRKQHSIPVQLEEPLRKLMGAAPPEQRIFHRDLPGGVAATREQVSALRGTNQITAAALYCDIYGLPPFFFNAIRRLANAGGYDLTHATLALVIIRARKCAYDMQVFENELVREMALLRRLLRNIRVDDDLGIEAILMLHLANKSPERVGEPSYVNPEWIDRILSAQSADGSWYLNDHTTAIALWLLLELRHSGY